MPWERSTVKQTRILLLFGTLLAAGCGDNAQKGALEVTYVGNEGFLVSMGGTKVLVDALPRSRYYVNPSDSLITAMMKGVPPFDAIDYFLVTHDHPDHFNAERVSRFLLSHPDAELIASSEACSKLNEETGVGSGRAGLDLALGQRQTIRGERAEIVVLRLDHGSGAEISNLAFVVRSNGYTFVHVGDARLSYNAESLRTIDWASYAVDLLFIEYFDHSSETREIIENLIKPRHVVLMHIPEGEEESVRNSEEKVHSRIVVFGKEGETKMFERPAPGVIP
jgi:L-ascorbate metabolism protein UlaG (beta-lactamase superfamily)